MATCKECSFFFPVPENAGDYKEGKGDCVTETVDAKGKYWLSRPTMNASPSCPSFKKSK
jgi:hypothetical protein